MRKIILLVLLSLFSCKNTNEKQTQKMENKSNFGWDLSVTAPHGYIVEVHEGYMATEKNFIAPFVNNGNTLGLAWYTDGNESGGGNIMPTQLSLTWMSYSEKKFWKLETAIPSEKILSYFREGFYNIDNVSHEFKHETYKHIVVAVAPGGVVVVFLSGLWHRVEIGRFQAKTVFVSVDEFCRNALEQTQQQFYEYNFDRIPADTKEVIKKKGIPYGLWDTYREKYNWKFTVQFYREDKFILLNTVYFNGEENYTYEKELNKNLFYKNAIPMRADISFIKYWCEAEFDWEEMHEVFKELTKDNHDAEIEIIAKIGFEYNDMEFRAKCGNRQIVLKKTKAAFWSNN